MKDEETGWRVQRAVRGALGGGGQRKGDPEGKKGEINKKQINPEWGGQREEEAGRKGTRETGRANTVATSPG